MCLEKYILWKWLIFFATVFWLALCATDEFCLKYLDKHLLQSQFDDEIFEEAFKDNILSFGLPEEDIIIENSTPNLPPLEVGNIWNTLLIFGIVSLFMLVHLRNGQRWIILPQANALVPVNTPNPDQPREEQEFVDEIIEESINAKPEFTPPLSRPPSRCMRVPSVDVKVVQAKLERLQQTIAAMRDRHSITPGIVTNTKEFQRFLTELKPLPRTVPPQFNDIPCGQA